MVWIEWKAETAVDVLYEHFLYANFYLATGLLTTEITSE